MGTPFLWPLRGRAQAVVLLPAPQSHPAPCLHSPPMLGEAYQPCERKRPGKGHSRHFVVGSHSGPMVVEGCAVKCDRDTVV